MNNLRSVRLPTLRCASIIYRAVVRKSHIHVDTGQVLREAFMRRRGRDEAGLSVCIECSPAECAADQERSAVLSVHLGFVLDLGLTVEVDEPQHANIVGLPYEDDLDPDKRYVAGRLAKHARYVLRPERRSARSIWDRLTETFGSEPIQMWMPASSAPPYWQAKFADGGPQRIPVVDLN